MTIIIIIIKYQSRLIIGVFWYGRRIRAPLDMIKGRMEFNIGDSGKQVKTKILGLDPGEHLVDITTHHVRVTY